VLPVAANGSPGLALYKPTSDGRYEAFGIKVIEQSGRKITGIHAFLDARLFGLFGLPLTLSR
jgi:RNA polymerase sigma-70 factor, ECF subfamily